MAWTALEQHAVDVLQELLELKIRAGDMLPRFALRAADLEVRTVLSEHLAALAALDLEPLFVWFDVVHAPSPGTVWLALYVEAERTLDRGRDAALVDARLVQHLLDLESLCAARCRMLAGWADTFGQVDAADQLRTLAYQVDQLARELAATPTPPADELSDGRWMPWT